MCALLRLADASSDPRWSPRHIKWFDVGPRVGSGKRVHLARSTEDAAPTAKSSADFGHACSCADRFGPPQVDVCKCIRSLSGAAATVSCQRKPRLETFVNWPALNGFQPSISVSLRTKCYGFAPRDSARPWTAIHQPR